MAVVIYSNGIVEEMIPLENTFSDKELIQSFEMYTSLSSYRLEEIPNCWCLWGYIDNPPENEFNKLASEIVEQDVYSHLIFIHDSELHPDLGLTDKIIYKLYKQFTEDVTIFMHNLMNDITEQHKQEYEESDQTSMIFLSALGHTKDKRVMFAFNPNEQHENFYVDDGWEKFVVNIHKYLKENFDKEPIEENKPFVIFSDSKTIVIVEDKNVDQVIDDMLSYFMKKEKYEICSEITEIKNKWYILKTLPSQGMIDPPETLDSSIGEKKKRKKPPPKNLDD